MNRKDRFLNELDGKGKVLSALLSVLTLFAVLGAVAPGLYERMPEYSEWICGLTTWSAYNKQADMNIVQIAMLGLPALFVLVSVFYVHWKRVTAGQPKTLGGAFVAAYVVILGMVYREDANAASWLVLWAVLFVGYFILAKTKRTDKFGNILTTTVISMLAMTAGILFLNGFIASVGSIWGKADAVVPLVGAIVFVILVLAEKLDDRAEYLLELQGLLPFAWIGCIHFRYRYEKDGALLELFASGRWKWMCVLLCILFLGIYILERIKRGRKLFFTTYIMTAVLRVFSQPEGLLNIDYFHNGEITMPMQQLVFFGKLPYRDVIPIHGLCDYYYGLISYLFFDGTYLSLNAAKVVGDLLMAVVIAGVIYFFVTDRKQGLAVIYLFMPFMILSAGMRYWMLFILFFVMFSPFVKKGMQSLYAWVALSILAIAWNASIGGAAALAFLPVVIYRFLRDIKVQWKELCCCKEKIRRNLIWAAWGVLVAAGIAFIPLFLKIVGYLRENTGTTLYVNGMEMLSDVSEAAGYFVPGLVNGQGDFFVHTFAFLIPLMVTFVFLFQKRKNGAGELFVTYLLAFWVLANYAFVRYDDGLRSKVLGIFFLLLTAVTLLYHICKEAEQEKRTPVTVLYAAVFGGALLLAGSNPFMMSDQLVLEKAIPAYVETTIMGREIDDPVVHVSGDLVSMPKLGTGFIQGNTLVSLQNVNTLMQAAKQNGQTVFDITNAVANTVTLDMPLYLPYSSAYNISNDVMQENAIRRLEGNLPDVILAAPEIRFDDAPFSFRSIKLYRYLMEQDYVPYKYENVIYLVRGENPLPQAQQNTEAFAQLMHKKSLGYLPAVWGSNAQNMSRPLSACEIGFELEVTETGFRLVFDEPVSGDAIAMVGIIGQMESKEEETTYMTMTMPSSIASEGQAQFEFACKGSNYLIPVCCSPYFTEEESIAYLEFATDRSVQSLAEQIEIQFFRW